MQLYDAECYALTLRNRVSFVLCMVMSNNDCTDENKTKIAKSGALVPLTRLARSKDMRVQRNATGALLNMTHSGTLPPCSSLLVTESLSNLAQTRTVNNWSTQGLFPYS